ncbi:L,D-transpeptidase [Sporolactobacillus putidus]|uniref:L,D-TPase catalytic domain-containing protein n=1 Tax=Sporolactobacillus putidus TaxID=492735 RepID=A0A917W4H4_9BACL|nr:L,D-transpeptidase [Sporolactobacillus putidus]GGL61777.1 hypothetical protein GCM10007968_27200 [Sporolactobacillus putidus]
MSTSIRKISIIVISSILIIAALIFAGISYYQATRFNARITINGTKVGGLTADQALKKLKTLILTNKVYVGQNLVFDGKSTKSGFTNQDLPEIKRLLGKQRTWWPSSKAENFSAMPSRTDHYRSQTLKGEVEAKLKLMNKSLIASKDAQAYLDHGQIAVSRSEVGKQYDITKLLKDYDNQEYRSEIYLKPILSQPIKENSQIVQNEKKKLQALVQRTVDYQVQNQTYPLEASKFIQYATVSKDMKLTMNTTDLKNEIAAINRSQSTLNKSYIFKTHTGSTISVQGQTYGWALDVGQETARIQSAFENGEKSMKAYNVYGIGYNTFGVGYHTTTNNGIGNTYAEVSIQEQRIWIYKNGQLAVTTPVVTGRHDTHEDTPTGVWYVMYKQSPSTLKGSEAGDPHYTVNVSYWAQFTDGGVGFHDASWRKNWASDAYLTGGSGGCVNTPPNVMKSVYDNLTQNEPVIVY